MSAVDWSRAGVEPPIKEIIEDPIVHLLLHRDGLTAHDVWAVVEKVAGRRREAGRAGATDHLASGAK